MQIIQIPSPNFTRSRNLYKPEAIVLHIMEGTLGGTDSWFRSNQSKVSAHYGVGLNGEVHQYVAETDTAWHAGRVNAPSWSLIKPAQNGKYINPNFYTIGIEHEGFEQTEWTDEMYNSSSQLISTTCSKWNIPLDRAHIIGHHEIYSLKTCPGSKIDIQKLISVASNTPPAPLVTPQKILQAGNVFTKVSLNIRNQPNTNLPPFTKVPPGVQLYYDGYTDQGEKINGNGKWFFTSNEKWFWSGGVR